MNASMRVNVMRACFPTGWKWPSTKDEIYYKSENIVKKINPPVPTEAGGGWQFSESILKEYQVIHSPDFMLKFTCYNVYVFMYVTLQELLVRFETPLSKQ